jgi:excisionase family DNA binding protein
VSRILREASPLDGAPAPFVRDKKRDNPAALVGPKDVAAFLGMSLRWVHERTRLKEIPHYHFGRMLRFDLTEVQAWMQQYRTGGDMNAASGRR